MPIIVGAPRSGTTLLRFMLDSHPNLAIPPETGFMALAPQLTGEGEALRNTFFTSVTTFPDGAPVWPDFQVPPESFRRALHEIDPFTIADGYRTFYRMYAARFGKPRWGDKTPRYGFHLQLIQSLLPEASFIHLIRDGRDVALSLRPLWFSPGSDMETLAQHWKDAVVAGRSQGAACRRYVEVRYEDLVTDPSGVLSSLCAFVDLDFDPAMLRYYERTPSRLREHGARLLADGREVVSHEQRLGQQRMTMAPPDPHHAGAWKKTMSADERARFSRVAGDLLTDLGYES